MKSYMLFVYLDKARTRGEVSYHWLYKYM